MLIQRLEIYSSNLKAQRHFYQAVLGFPLIEDSPDRFAIQVGASEMHIVEREGCAPIHFAFNIPSNQIQEAFDWLSARTPILESEGDQIHQFENWDAEAIYFYDADGNIGELIARHKLEQESAAPFGVESMLSVSEIAHGSSGIQGEIQLLKGSGLEIHSGGPERFCSVGTESGLFILVNTDAKGTWFPTSDPVLPANFHVTIQGGTELQSYSCSEGQFSRSN